jgi:hypothetical protein
MNRYKVLLENERKILTSVKKLIREVIINEGDTSGSTDAENILAILMSNQSMTKEEFLKSRNFKILAPVVFAALVFTLWRDGYQFGQWLYAVMHR